MCHENVPDDSPETGTAVPWQRSDYSGDARLLVWGVSLTVFLGNSDTRSS